MELLSGADSMLAYSLLLFFLCRVSFSCIDIHVILTHGVSDIYITEKSAEQPSKSSKVTGKPGAAASGKGVHVQKDVSLAAANPRAPVTRAPGPRQPGPLPGNPRGPPPGQGMGRGRGGPPPRR